MSSVKCAGFHRVGLVIVGWPHPAVEASLDSRDVAIAEFLHSNGRESPVTVTIAERKNTSVEIPKYAIRSEIGTFWIGSPLLHPSAPFDISVGRVAVVEDPFGNPLVLLDLSKGTYETDTEGNVTGVS